MNARMLAGFGIVDIAAGVVVWLVTGNAAIGVALIVLGAVVLGVAAATNRGSRDPESAWRNEQADQQRLEDETRAGAESAEDRPPPTGG